MSLLTEASLIVTPNAYNVGKLYSVIPNTTLGDMDVSRGSSATRVNSAGFIEIARTNNVLYSNDLSQSIWSKANYALTSATSIQGLTTTRITKNATSNGAYKNSQARTLNTIATFAAGTKTLTWLIRKGNTDKVGFLINNVLVGVLTSVSCEFDFTTQTFTNISLGLTASFENPTTDVYKIILTINDIGVSTSKAIWIAPIDNSNNTFDGGYLDFAFAQWEAGETATDYIPTTTSIRTKFAGITQDGGVAQNIPRIDYTGGGCPSILVEPARTNLVLYSEEFTNVIWDKGATISLVSNTTETASPQGINNATKATANGTGFIFIRQNVFPTTTLPTTNSIFVKKANNRYVGFRNGGSGTLHDVFDFNTETWTNNSGSTLSFDKLINGWYRLKSSRTNTLVNNYTSITIPSNTSGTETETVSNLTLYLWGGQSELNVLNATSYIPTTTAAVPRDADVISKTGITTLIGQTEGTLFVDVNFEAESIAKYYLTLGTSSAFNIAISARANNKIGMEVFNSTGQVNITSTSTYTTNQRLKIAMTYKLNDFKLYVNGVLQATDTSGTVPTTAAVVLGSFATSTSQAMDGINLAILWKTPLTDDQCILLTGPSFSSYPEMASALIYTLQ